MLNENIKRLRKDKGYTQETLAQQLGIVRQTVSKWEKGLSVPDAELLQKLAEILDTNVGELLGAASVPEKDGGEVAQQLARINEQLAIKNRRARRVWNVVAVIVSAILLVNALLILLGVTAFHQYRNSEVPVEVIEQTQFPGE